MRAINRSPRELGCEAVIGAFDVTDRVTRIAWQDRNGERGFREIEELKASQVLLPELDALLNEVGEPLEQLGVIRGPGSFTGIRVGLATALGLRESLGIPVYAVDKFTLMKLACPDADAVLAVAGGRDRFFVEKAGRRFFCSTAELEEETSVWIPLTGPPCCNRLHLHFADFLLAQIAAETFPPSDELEPLYVQPPDAKKGQTLLEKLLGS